MHVHQRSSQQKTSGFAPVAAALPKALPFWEVSAVKNSALWKSGHGHVPWPQHICNESRLSTQA